MSLLYISSSFPWYISVLSQNRGLKRNGSFHSGSPFQLNSFALPGVKAVQRLCNLPPNTEAKWQRGRERNTVKRDKEVRKEWRTSDPCKCLAPSDPVNGFPLSGYGERGWVGGRVLPSSFTHFLRRWSDSVATRLRPAVIIGPGSR